LSEREHLTHAVEAIAKYELLLAAPNNDQLKTLLLSSAFRIFLTKTSLSDVTQGISELMEFALTKNRSAATTDKFLFHCNFASEQFDRIVASGLREFTFLCESFNLADTHPMHKLSPLIHLPPNKSATDYQECTTHELAVQDQEAVGLDKSKVALHSTTLYIGGCMLCPENALVMIYNMRTFLARSIS
jgi:hypothetical protein